MEVSGRAESLAVQERVQPFLLADRGLRAVPTVHFHVVTKREQLRADAGKQGGHVSARQVGTADAALKEHITCDNEALGFTPQSDMPR